MYIRLQDPLEVYTGHNYDTYRHPVLLILFFRVVITSYTKCLLSLCVTNTSDNRQINVGRGTC